ncbi:hypothetical protein ACGFWD_18740 [Streptomyces sp. NPDC048448]|uniref:hypothetical protein n=1 Tax=unclassified Streptomyces TaxID=2593676 RepID=UPI00143E470E|nr:hypothetical protein [Streptomyces sp. RPA4-2]QIY61400.1 hypothetical protein HEP85_06610 [Streptomyces sp. RPA4-2]
MYEPEEPASGRRAAHVVAWLSAREEVENVLREPLGGLPSQQDETASRMAGVLQATALGLGPDAAAIWAGVPDRVLHGWLEKDSVFAAAVKSAGELAAAHGPHLHGKVTAAQLRVMLIAISRGETWLVAARLAGISTHQYRKLWAASPAMVALVNAARSVRPRKSKHLAAPAHRRLWPASADRKSYRLVRRDDPQAPPDTPRAD